VGWRLCISLFLFLFFGRVRDWVQVHFFHLWRVGGGNKSLCFLSLGGSGAGYKFSFCFTRF